MAMTMTMTVRCFQQWVVLTWLALLLLLLLLYQLLLFLLLLVGVGFWLVWCGVAWRTHTQSHVRMYMYERAIVCSALLFGGSKMYNFQFRLN